MEWLAGGMSEVAGDVTLKLSDFENNGGVGSKLKI